MTFKCDICKKEYEVNNPAYRLDSLFKIFARNTLKQYQGETYLCPDCTVWLVDIINEEKKTHEV